ncbi:MAG: VWA domain-containing protein [Bacteriovoracia bacterium]
MNFNQFNYWPGILALLLSFIVIVMFMEKRFFQFVKTYWFYNRSLLSYLSTVLFLLGIGGLLFSLLDIRGPEQKIKTEVPKDRTIILMDTSASMLAEDVKPSRLQKATLIAKHFARKAAGHQISIVAFAEIQKKIVPFTNDIDLIDARLDSIESLRNQYGSSAVTHAIQESIQYFRETGGEARGNILVLTDGEETAEGIDLKVPKGVHVALIGIGTERGGRIPLDDGRGFRFGYKKERGKDVVTKLNEKFFKNVVSEIPSGKYWLANSYSLPSEEVLNFFQKEKVKTNNQEDMVIRPVLMEWIVVPSIIFLILSYLLKSVKVFSLGLLLLIAPVHAQEKPEPELSPEVIMKLDELQRGELSRLEKIKLADDLSRAGAHEEALSLYEENLPSRIDKEVPAEAYLNYGTTLLQKGEIKKALDTYKNLSDSVGDGAESDKLRETMDRNIVTYFQQLEQKKKQQQKKNQENKDQQNRNQKDNNQSGQGQNKEQQGSSKEQQKKKEDQGSGEKKKEEKEQGNEDSEEKDKKDESEDKNQDNEQGDPEEKKLPPKKIPAKLKQLMSDDRQLQIKMIEMGTKDLNKRKSRKSKDW